MDTLPLTYMDTNIFLINFSIFFFNINFKCFLLKINILSKNKFSLMEFAKYLIVFIWF